MPERRYSEDEVAAIFERAADAQRHARRQLPAGDGMTIGDLQAIAREVGIPPELVTEAARSIEPGGRPPIRRFFGLPIGVGRTIELSRPLTEQEWEQLVVDLRETFDARGRVRADGAFRQWTNGNLQALLEPTPTGHRVRLQTVKGDARGLMTGGLATLGVSVVVLVGLALSGRLADASVLMGPGFLATIGAGMFGMGALRLPAWARRRLEQMDAVAARLALKAPSSPDEAPSDQSA